MRKGGGLGLVALVVVLAVVLLLAARQWRAVAPTAMQLDQNNQPVAVKDHGETGAGEALRSGKLPDLNDMRAGTGAHADQLEEALAETD